MKNIKKYKEFLIEGNVFKKENETKNFIDSFLINKYTWMMLKNKFTLEMEPKIKNSI